ncbi:hypothetical protein GCM10017764_22810 [Sphingobacterium griseoflavum]|uniref:Uncharacterized protein n=2 Tax=Sphingobacterium griseoflavum TaxID=1474952 RepID=A0ABQ3HXZ2_9SPHI|nr:hypothetical protein GCM10017764_22810 [Sphingobacterium griseoflavum]
MYKNIYSLIGIVLLLSIFWFLGNLYLDDFIEGNLARFQQVDNQSHRFAGYETGWNVFSSNFFGLGVEDLMNKIKVKKLNAIGLWTDFGTLDNFFITHLASYGILAIIHFSFFYFYLFKSYKFYGVNSNYFKAHFFLYLIMSLIGLSFDLEFYTIILILWASCSAILLKYKRLENNGINVYPFSNKSYL